MIPQQGCFGKPICTSALADRRDPPLTAALSKWYAGLGKRSVSIIGREQWLLADAIPLNTKTRARSRVFHVSRSSRAVVSRLPRGRWGNARAPSRKSSAVRRLRRYELALTSSWEGQPRPLCAAARKFATRRLTQAGASSGPRERR